MFNHYKKIAFKKEPVLLYDKIEDMRIFRYSDEPDRPVIEILNNINLLEKESLKYELLKKTVNKIISYSKLNLIEYNEKNIIKLNTLGIGSPLKFSCYSNKYTPLNMIVIDDIKKVINYLLEKCNLSIMEVYKTHNYKETIFDMLNNTSNTMHIDIKKNINNYLLIDCKNYILNDFKYMLFNLKDKQTILDYQNKIMFIMCNYNIECFDLIIKFLSVKENINNIGFIVTCIFSKNYINKCNIPEYDFMKNYENIIKLMIDKIWEYIDDINIYNFLNFIWAVLLLTELKETAGILLKEVIWKHVIIRINKLIEINNKDSNDIIMNFMLSADIFTINLISKYLKKHKFVY